MQSAPYSWPLLTKSDVAKQTALKSPTIQFNEIPSDGRTNDASLRFHSGDYSDYDLVLSRVIL
jgi:hypothetical protein